MFSEKQTQIGQTSLNLQELRWTLTTKISKGFELLARVPRGAASSLCLRDRGPPRTLFLCGLSEGLRAWEAEKGAGRGKSEGFAKAYSLFPSYCPRPTFLQSLMIKQACPGLSSASMEGGVLCVLDTMTS